MKKMWSESLETRALIKLCKKLRKTPTDTSISCYEWLAEKDVFAALLCSNSTNSYLRAKEVATMTLDQAESCTSTLHTWRHFRSTGCWPPIACVDTIHSILTKELKIYNDTLFFIDNRSYAMTSCFLWGKRGWNYRQRKVPTSPGHDSPHTVGLSLSNTHHTQRLLIWLSTIWLCIFPSIKSQFKRQRYETLKELQSATVL